MQLKNTTDHSDRCLRRIVSFCCRIIDYKVGMITKAEFRNRSHAYSGRAYYNRRGGGRIVVSISTTDTGYPMTCRKHVGMNPIVFADRIEALVGVTAHEIAHLAQNRDGRHKLVEHDACWNELQVLKAFRVDREVLIAEWSKEPAQRPVTPKQSKQEKRAESAVSNLANWERKQKLASTKVRHWSNKVKYYDRAMAAKRRVAG